VRRRRPTTATPAGLQANCQQNVCGDGFVGPGEACDDGNGSNDDACTNVCKLATCGDGFKQPGEQCDLGGNNSNTGACTLACKLPVRRRLQAGRRGVRRRQQRQHRRLHQPCKNAKCGDGFV
jgi:cysteine-rich repeat protein